MDEWILVAGGCGYIGSHVVRQLTRNGARVVVVDDLSTGFPSALIGGERLEKADITDLSGLRRVFSGYRISSVFHFAASTVVPESVKHPLPYYRNNTLGTLNLLQSCVEHGVKQFVFSSTAAVYGNQPIDRVSETCAPSPESPYARTKLISEGMIADCRLAQGLDYAVLRYFNVAGASLDNELGQSTNNATHLIKVACQQVLSDKPNFTVYGDDYPTPDGTCVRDYIHVEDLADAHVLALDHLRRGGGSGIFNCGYGKGYSVLDILAAVEKAAGKPMNPRMGSRRPGDLASVVADPSLIRRTFNWIPKHDSLETIVSTALRWEERLRGRAFHLERSA